MKRNESNARVLCVIESDPETSPRPAEAVRIAAGLAAWKDLETDLLLIGPGNKILSAFPEELMDGQIFRDYLPVLTEKGGTIYQENEGLVGTQSSQIKAKKLESSKLPAVLKQYRHLLHF